MSDFETEITIPIPLDEGFLRRECPACERQFKWWHGQHPSRPVDAVDPEEYHCPYCGATAGSQSWYTHSQIDLIENRAGTYASEYVREALADSIRDLNRTGFIQAELSGGPSSEALPLDEPHDMVQSSSPCHSWEPVKYEESWSKPLYCLVCGTAYDVAS